MENLKILVVEDNKEHMEDAKKTFDFLLEKGAPVEFHYAETLKETEVLMEEIEFDGIITDVFFPYDEEVRDDNLPGWDYGTAARCRKFIKLPDIYEGLVGTWEWNENCRRNHERLKGEGHYTRPETGYALGEWLIESAGYKNETLQKHNAWMQGKAMHPSGMLVALECVKRNIPFKFETDQTGHGSITEAVFQTVSSKFQIKISDWVYRDKIKKVKKWYFSYSNLIAQIWIKKRGCFSKNRELDGSQEQYDYIQHMGKHCASPGFLGKPRSPYAKEEPEENENIKRSKALLTEVAKNEKEVIDFINS